MNFKAIITSVIVASTALIGGSAAPAEASTCFNVPGIGASICNEYKGTNSYGQVYTLGYADDNGKTTGMTVTCRGAHVVDWQSNGNMSYEYNDAVAQYFCEI